MASLLTVLEQADDGGHDHKSGSWSLTGTVQPSHVAMSLKVETVDGLSDTDQCLRLRIPSTQCILQHQSMQLSKFMSFTLHVSAALCSNFCCHSYALRVM
jgi:hypothetical protein